MRQPYSRPPIEVGDEVAIVRFEHLLHGRVVEMDGMGHCVIAIGDTTSEGFMTISETKSVTNTRLSPLGVGRWVVVDPG